MYSNHRTLLLTVSAIGSQRIDQGRLEYLRMIRERGRTCFELGLQINGAEKRHLNEEFGIGQ